MAERALPDRYQILRLLGEGGMGRVYLARTTASDQRVVLKVLHEHHATARAYRDAFRQEVEFLARFRHPYAVRLLEASLDGPEIPWAVLEFADGLPLDTLLERDGRFTAARAGRLLGHLCAVLQAAHDLGIIHRDLKPANIVVVDPGTPAEHPKVLDFGLARQVQAAAQGVYIPLEKFAGSHAHKAVGTPEYTCPEQFRGEEVDHRGDLYSVGILLYELLAGRRPFAGATIADLIAAHLRATVPPLAGLVPPAIEAVVRSCLAKDPAERPPNARELALRYGEALGQPIWNEAEARALPATSSSVPAARDDRSDAAAWVYRYEAWMPERIAALKLRGFVDGRGEVRASQPGFLRVHLRRPRRAVAAAPSPTGLLARLGLGKRPEPAPAFDLVTMDVHLDRPDAALENRLLVTVRMCPPGATADTAEDWQTWCDQAQRDLAAYLMARRL